MEDESTVGEPVSALEESATEETANEEWTNTETGSQLSQPSSSSSDEQCGAGVKRQQKQRQKMFY